MKNLHKEIWAMIRSLARGWFVLAFVLACAAAMTCMMAAEYVSGKVWPEPKVIDPGNACQAPSDAIVLFDGKDLSKWDGKETLMNRFRASLPAIKNDNFPLFQRGKLSFSRYPEE